MNASNASGADLRRPPADRSPLRYARTVFRSGPRCLAIAEIDQPLFRSAVASISSLPDNIVRSLLSVARLFIANSFRERDLIDGGWSRHHHARVGRFSEQVWGDLREREHRLLHRAARRRSGAARV